MTSDARLTIPPSVAPWPEIWRFALSYNGYDGHGGFDGAAQIGNASAERWSVDGSLPDSLATARAALFFEQRRHRHFDSDPQPEAAAYIRALVDHIRELSGGNLMGPPDPLP